MIVSYTATVMLIIINKWRIEHAKDRSVFKIMHYHTSA